MYPPNPMPFQGGSGPYPFPPGPPPGIVVAMNAEQPQRRTDF